MEISSAYAQSAGQASGSVSKNMAVSVMAMQQDQAKQDGKAALKLMDSAAQIQATGTGGKIDITA